MTQLAKRPTDRERPAKNVLNVNLASLFSGGRAPSVVERVSFRKQTFQRRHFVRSPLKFNAHLQLPISIVSHCDVTPVAISLRSKKRRQHPSLLRRSRVYRVERARDSGIECSLKRQSTATYAMLVFPGPLFEDAWHVSLPPPSPQQKAEGQRRRRRGQMICGAIFVIIIIILFFSLPPCVLYYSFSMIIVVYYRVTLMVAFLGWVDFDLDLF